MGFARWIVTYEGEGLRECIQICMLNLNVSERLQPLNAESKRQPVWCWSVSTGAAWWSIYISIINGEYSPSGCMTRSTPWLTIWKRSSTRLVLTKFNYRRKTTQRWQACSHHKGWTATSGIQSLLFSSICPIKEAARVKVAVQIMRSMQVTALIGEILCNVTDAIQ